MEETRILKEGETTKIEIPFSANPTPEVTWSFNGGALPVDARRIKQETILGMTSLVLAKIKMAESGKYRILLKNEFGDAELTFNIKVIGKNKCIFS